MSQPLVQRASRRVGTACLVAAAAFPVTAHAQVAGYPAKPVRMIVPFTAGSPIEIPARAVAQRLAETMGQPFLIDNRPGASGTIGTELVAKAARDGYTLLVTNCSHSSNPSHYRKLPYDSLADFTPVTQINVTYGNLLVVHPSVPTRSVKEFITLAKANPGRLNYASAGIGSPPHVTGAVFAAMAGIQLTHVPYKGTSVAFNDVLAGYVEVMFASPTFAHPFIQAGRVRALGIGGPRRAPLFPDVPTFHETGLTGYEVTCYHGCGSPPASRPKSCAACTPKRRRQSPCRRCANTSWTTGCVRSAARRKSLPNSSGRTSRSRRASRRESASSRNNADLPLVI